MLELTKLSLKRADGKSDFSLLYDVDLGRSLLGKAPKGRAIMPLDGENRFTIYSEETDELFEGLFVHDCVLRADPASIANRTDAALGDLLLAEGRASIVGLLAGTTRLGSFALIGKVITRAGFDGVRLTEWSLGAQQPDGSFYQLFHGGSSATLAGPAVSAQSVARP